jgi:fatty-acyl-CoA synthase
MTGASRWPRCAEPADLAATEAVPLAERNLPQSTYALPRRAATATLPATPFPAA